MIITTNMLLVKLKQTYPHIKISEYNKDDNQHIQGVRMYTKRSQQFQSDYLYICDATAFAPLKEPPASLRLICVCTPNESVQTTASTIVIKTILEQAEILNTLHEIYASFQTWDRQMHEALIQNADFQRLLEISSPFFAGPVLIYDLGIKLLAYDKQHLVEDKVFSHAISEGYLSSDTLKEFELSGILEKVIDDQILIFEPGHTNKHLTMFMPFKTDGKATGYCVMLLLDQTEIECQKTFFMNFYEYANTCMQQLQRNMHTEGFMYEYALLDLLHNKDLKESAVKEHIEYIGIPFESDFYLILLDFKKSSSGLIPFILHRIQTILPETRAFKYQNQIMILIYANKQLSSTQYREQIPVLLSNLQKEIQPYDLQCAVSKPFYKITHIPSAHEQLKATLELHGKLHPEKDTKEFLFFENYQLFYMCHLSHTAIRPEHFIPAALREIMLHDESKGTQYTVLLQTYLQQSCRLPETAEILHMHRNNVVYHLRKMENRFHLNLENTEERLKLQIAFYILSLRNDKKI